MESQTSRATYSPSLLWVLPIACSVWIGIFVDGWLANPSESNRYHTILEPALEGLLTPGVSLLLVWLLGTPASLVFRLQVASFVLISSLPIAYLSHQRPGLAWTSVFEVRQYYVDRTYYVGAQGQSFPELFLALAVAAFVLLILNRNLSHVVFYRVPIRGGADGTKLYKHMTDAYRSAIYSAEEEIANRRAFDQCLFASSVGLVVIGFVCSAIGYGDRFLNAAWLGMLIGGLFYFWLWPASECRRPFWALLVMLPGVVVFSTVAQFLRLSRSFSSQIWTTSEQALIIGTIVVPLVLVWLSLVLLTATNQMPRRTKGLWTVESGASRSVAPGRNRSVRTWLFGICLWLLACLSAYWIPQNVDSEALTGNDRISLRDGWLAAQFLQKLEGIRAKIRFRYDINSDQSWVALRVPRYSEYWASCIELMEQRAREGDVCQLVVDEPILDLAFREHLMQQGILIYNPDEDDVSYPNSQNRFQFNPFRWPGW